MTKTLYHDRDLPPVIIFGGSGTTYGVIRALSPKQIPIFLVSKDSTGIALKSKFQSGHLIAPPDQNDFFRTFYSWVLKTIQTPAVLMVTDDLYLDALAANYENLYPDLIPTFPDSETVIILREKSKTIELARAIGIPTPKTKLITNRAKLEEFFLNDREIMFPIIARPQKSNIFDTRGILCNTSKDLKKCFAKYKGFNDQMLIQELIPGPEDNLINVSIVSNNMKEPLAIFMNRKRRSMGQFGPGTLVSSTWSDILCEYTLKLVKGIGCIGYAEAEFKLDERDGKYKLIEINSRISALNSHSLKVGVNLPYLLYREALEGPIKPTQNLYQTYPENILWWNLPLDIISVLRTNCLLHPTKLIKSFIGKGLIVEPLNLRDLYPFIAAFINLLKPPINKIFKAVYRRRLNDRAI